MSAIVDVIAREILEADNDALAFDPPDPDRVYRSYLETCEMLGIEPVPREQALGLIREWTEVVSRRPEPMTH